MDGLCFLHGFDNLKTWMRLMGDGPCMTLLMRQAVPAAPAAAPPLKVHAHCHVPPPPLPPAVRLCVPSSYRLMQCISPFCTVGSWAHNKMHAARNATSGSRIQPYFPCHRPRWPGEPGRGEVEGAQ